MISRYVGDTRRARGVLADTGMTADEIHGVVLVGGSTRVPVVRSGLADTDPGCRAPLTDIDPDGVVAMGAALRAEALTGGSDTLLLDVTPLSSATCRDDGRTGREDRAAQYADTGPTRAGLHDLSGRPERDGDPRGAGRAQKWSRIAAAWRASNCWASRWRTAGAARIRVTFAVDADGLLTVSADSATGIQQRIEVKPSHGLKPRGHGRHAHDIDNAEEDMARRLLAEARVEAKRNMRALDAALAKDDSLLSDEGAMRSTERMPPGSGDPCR